MTPLSPFGLGLLILAVLAVIGIIAVWIHDRKKA